MVRAAVAGLGWMGDLHSAVYRDMPDVELVGLVEPDEAKHAHLEAEHGVPVFVDAEPLLGQVDIVSVCAPDDRHVEATVPFLAAGARVLVEKPLAMSTADAREILAARPRPEALSVGHVLRFDPRVIRCREVVRSGELGKLWHVDVWRDTSRAVAAAPAQRTSVAWFLGIHDADLVRFVTGLEVERVSAIGRPAVSRHADVVYANIQYTAGVIGTMENTWTLPNGRPNRALAGLRVVGSEGSVEIDLGHVDMIHATEQTAINLDTRNWPSRERTGVSNIRSEVEAFVAAAVADGPAPVPGEDGLAAVRVVEMIHASLAADGAVISRDDAAA